MKPNKLKRNLILIFSIVIILFATIFVLYMTTDIFRTKRDAFFRYAMQIPDVFDVLDTNSDYQTYQKTKQTNTYLTTGEMKITSSENIADESILSKVNMIVFGKTDNKKEQANYDITIRSDNNNLFSMTAARDKDLYGFYSEQIADGYIVFRNDNLTELATKMNIENAKNLFDNTSDTVATLSQDTSELIYSFTKPQFIDMLTLTSSKDSKAPEGFKVYGSNDAKSWQLLEERANLEFEWGRYTRPFVIHEADEFKHYKLELIGGC